MVTTRDRVDAPARAVPPSALVRFAPLLAGLAATALAAARSFVPSPWTDEVVTLTLLRRPLGDLLAMLGDVDAVHGLYYVVLRAWAVLAGDGIVAARMLSALAIGVAAAGVVVLARALGAPAAAPWAGAVFVALPVTTWVGSEARSTALVAAGAVWAGVALVRAIERGGWWWLGYAALMTVTVGLFVQASLLFLAHGLAVLWAGGASRRLLAWAASAAGVAVVLAPFVLLVLGQRGQVSWLTRPEPVWVARRIVALWFGGSPVVALVVVGLAVLAVVAAWRAGGARTTALVRLTLPWLLVPGAVLVAVSWVLEPMFHPRYLVHCCAAMALLAGAGLAAIGRRTWRIVVAAVLGVACAVAIAVTSGPYARDLADWRSAADVVAERAEPSDVVLFAPDRVSDERGPRRAMDAFPGAFDDLDDPGSLPGDGDGHPIWDGGLPVEDVPASDLEGEDRVWLLVGMREYPAESAGALDALEAEGYDGELIWSGPSTEVYLFSRDG
ncbi:hypothetical protein [Beutenbergia cavernae]|nr:hypothetical protein [Beutenbergia cavernae]